MIKQITLVAGQGVKTYYIGQKLDAGVVDEIKIAPIRFTGDPFDHYCGFSESGKLLFTVEPSAPCEVEYL